MRLSRRTLGGGNFADTLADRTGERVMAITIKPGYRAPAVGVASAALIVGSFLLGTAHASPAAGGTATTGGTAAFTTATTGGKITVTGTGTVNGTPNQLVLSMGVQINSSSVSSALGQANQAAHRVIASLKSGGVQARDIQTSGLSIQPNYSNGNTAPVGYGVSEQLTATLRDLAAAGSQIQAAVTAGGNATTVDGVSLNLTDSGTLLARARAAAVRDAQAKASQFAKALGHQLRAVVSLSSQSSVPYPIYYATALAGNAAAPSVPVSPGRQQVSVQVTVVYAIG
jgi:uncharacterized protein